MQDHPKLIPGRLYHIYNRGINSCAIFREEDNYRHFLWLYGKHVAPVVETYAWVLLPTLTLTGFKTLSGLLAMPRTGYRYYLSLPFAGVKL